MTDDQTVYVVTYRNQWPDDGFELGGVYATEAEAEKAGGERRCARSGWQNYSVSERIVQEGTDGE